MKAEENLGISRRNHRWFAPVLAELRRIYPQKLAFHLADDANRSERVCEDWIASPPRGAPDGEALAALLTGRHGRRLLLALAKSSAHDWAAQLQNELELSELRADLQAKQRRIERLERGER